MAPRKPKKEAKPPVDNGNDDGGDILEFTPDESTPIEEVADTVVSMMQLYDMDAEVHFPHFTMEVDRSVTAEEIVEAYNDVTIDFVPDLSAPKSGKAKKPRKPK